MTKHRLHHHIEPCPPPSPRKTASPQNPMMVALVNHQRSGCADQLIATVTMEADKLGIQRQRRSKKFMRILPVPGRTFGGKMANAPKRGNVGGTTTPPPL